MITICGPLLATSTDGIQTRISGYRTLGASYKALNEGIRRNAEPEALLKSAREIHSAARSQYGWFPAGSGPRAGVKTAAKAIIWSQPAKFRAAQNQFAAQSEALLKAVKTGNAGVIRTEARKLGGTCKSCHDQYREES